MEHKSARAKVRALGLFDCNGHPEYWRFYCTGIYYRIIYTNRMDAK